MKFFLCPIWDTPQGLIRIDILLCVTLPASCRIQSFRTFSLAHLSKAHLNERYMLLVPFLMRDPVSWSLETSKALIGPQGFFLWKDESSPYQTCHHCNTSWFVWEKYKSFVALEKHQSLNFFVVATATTASNSEHNCKFSVRDATASAAIIHIYT